MIIHHTNYGNIDFTKYKRVFIFGCSFTNYMWPTWANILAYETKDADVYNLAKPGAGNFFISEEIVVTNQKFKFNKDDLILVMWSTYFREDRYIKDSWKLAGNIFTQNVYDEDFVKRYACVKGFIIRDLALITLTKHFLETLTSDVIMLKATDINYTNKNIFFDEYNIDDLVHLYKDTIDNMGLSLSNYVKNQNQTINNSKTKMPVCDSRGWYIGHRYYSSNNNQLHYDYHPNSKMYLNFLLDIGFNLSENTKTLVLNLNDELMKLNKDSDISNWFNSFNTKLKKYNTNTKFY